MAPFERRDFCWYIKRRLGATIGGIEGCLQARANVRRRLGTACFKIAPAACAHTGLHDGCADRRTASFNGRFPRKGKGKL
jgi:hypothetical protein